MNEPARDLRDGLQRITVPNGDLRYFRGGTGAPVLLLHTLRTQLEYFEPLIRRLDLDRIDAIAPDLPGHGESNAPRAEYTADYFTDAVEQFLDALDVNGVIVAADSIGASIGLALAARGNVRVRCVVAVNTYDYGRWGGIRRNSLLSNVLFTAVLVPGVGAAVVHTEMKWILRRVVGAGLHDRKALPSSLVDQLRRGGALAGHPRAFRSLLKHWRTWIAARKKYASIKVPVTLAYGNEDWSRPDERQANAREIPGARSVTIENAGHFAALDRPDETARLIDEAIAGPSS